MNFNPNSFPWISEGGFCNGAVRSHCRLSNLFHNTPMELPQFHCRRGRYISNIQNLFGKGKQECHFFFFNTLYSPKRLIIDMQPIVERIVNIRLSDIMI